MKQRVPTCVSTWDVSNAEGYTLTHSLGAEMYALKVEKLSWCRGEAVQYMAVLVLDALTAFASKVQPPAEVHKLDIAPVLGGLRSGSAAVKASSLQLLQSLAGPDDTTQLLPLIQVWWLLPLFQWCLINVKP